ncbi:PBSX family phage terminase large subunit [Weissella confusa]|uniref:PBSX family phage terminase large subunit n=1 Tax=Weissella confusa TaxID=1583 RepID=UPI001C6F8625|nr:PBSX family phage terminase large subunit [Weissella confusa]QYU58201.1 PBSX family phage terminase large subunit [Weissella confusa]
MSKEIVLEFPKPSKVFNKQIYDHLYEYDNRIDLWYGGAASGKSHGVVQKVIIKALQPWKVPRRVLVLRKVGATIKDSVFEDFIERLSSWNLLELCKVNNTDRRITLPNGAEFMFKGLDNPEKIKSIKGISDVVMEEATEFTLDDFTQLNLRLREKKHDQKQIFIMFNPVSKVNWVYKTFFEKEFADTKIHLSTYKDNRFLDEHTQRTLMDLSKTNAAYYKIYALGEFATLDKLIFPEYKKAILNKDDPELRRIPSFFGLDFGYTNDPSAFVHIKVDTTNRKLYIMEEYGKTGMLNDEIAEAIKSLGYNKEVIVGDAAEQKSIEEIRRYGVPRIVPAHKGKDSVLHGIEYMQQFEIIVDERCVKTIEELDNYAWERDKKSGEYINRPVDLYNHFIDAIRYALAKSANYNNLSVKQRINAAKAFF